MDLAAEFYLQTVETVFVRHALPQGRDDPSRPADRSGRDQARRAAHGRRRARRHFRRRPDRGGAPAVRRTFPPTARRIGCSPASAITACSTARASAPRSRRASPISCCRWATPTARARNGAGKRARAQRRRAARGLTAVAGALSSLLARCKAVKTLRFHRPKSRSCISAPTVTALKRRRNFGITSRQCARRGR